MLILLVNIWNSFFSFKEECVFIEPFIIVYFANGQRSSFVTVDNELCKIKINNTSVSITFVKGVSCVSIVSASEQQIQQTRPVKKG